MKVEILTVGPLRTKCYLIIKDKQCLVVDPGAEPERIINFIKEHNLNPKGYLITHGHFDHMMAVEDIKAEFGIELHTPDELFNYEIISTPGHTKDSICFYFKDNDFILTGDTLFKETVGRTDFPGGNEQDLIKSLEILKKLPVKTVVYPGHGNSTTIGAELKNNEWLR